MQVEGYAVLGVLTHNGIAVNVLAFILNTGQRLVGWQEHVTVAGNPGTLKALPPSLLVQYHFTDLGAIKPYVGVGMNYTSFTSVSVPAIPTASLSSNSTGGVAQIGVDYMIDKNWGLNFDLKYIQIKTEVYAGGADKGQLALNPTAAALGVTYRY